ncbi:MAG: hypothetical protein IT380_16570 [Myxococcales bacterium]|nr:hypothetical protein [Myxococcales bacterium]
MTTIRQKRSSPIALTAVKPRPAEGVAAKSTHLRDQFQRPHPAAHPVIASRPVGLRVPQVVGKKALDAFFSAHVKQHTPAATGLKKLLAEGSLDARAAAAAGKSGVTTSELASLAKDLEPFFAELGVAGEAMARTAVDCLAAAGDEVAKLADKKMSEVVDRSLPLHLADGLTRHLGAAANQAGRELFQTGLLSAESFAKLGAQGIGQLALALELGLGVLGPLAQQAGGALLRQAAEGLGKASELLKPGASYPDFVGDFFNALPASGKPLWEEKRSTRAQTGDVGPNGELPGYGAFNQKKMEAFAGTTGRVGQQGDSLVAEGRAGAIARAQGEVKGEQTSVNPVCGNRVSVRGAAGYQAEAWAGTEGRASLGPDGADAWGRVGTGASFHGDASFDGSNDFGLVGASRVHGEATADASVYAGAEGSAHAGLDGASVHLRAGAEAEAEVSANLSLGQETLGGLVGWGGEAAGYAEARAAAQVTAEGHVGFDQEGDVEAYVGVSAELIAEANAGGSVANTINFFGFKLTLGGYGAVAASAGVKAGAGAGYRDGEFYALADVGAGAAAGGDVGLFAKVELPPWAQGVMNTLGKTEAGRAALGAVGMVLNPLIGMVAQAAAPKGAPAA